MKLLVDIIEKAAKTLKELAMSLVTAYRAKRRLLARRKAKEHRVDGYLRVFYQKSKPKGDSVWTILGTEHGVICLGDYWISIATLKIQVWNGTGWIEREYGNPIDQIMLYYVASGRDVL